MRAAVERLEAQGPLTGARASSQDAPTGLRKVREGASQAPGAVASRVYPTCALNKPISGKPEIGRAPSPWERGKENGKRANPGPEQQRTGAAKRWLNWLFDNRIHLPRRAKQPRFTQQVRPFGHTASNNAPAGIS